MSTISITRSLEAEQWLPERGEVPRGAVPCKPEVHWSADRTLIYFTYADLRPHHWLGVERLPMPTDPANACGPLEELITFEPKDAGPYARKSLPFALWSVKSESSVKMDHRALFLDADDAGMLALWHDYCSAEQWPNPIPRRMEFRVVDGGYGRGYVPFYLAAGDWLVRDPDAEHGIRVVPDEELAKLRCIPEP